VALRVAEVQADRAAKAEAKVRDQVGALFDGFQSQRRRCSGPAPRGKLMRFPGQSGRISMSSSRLWVIRYNSGWG